jgi:hypothetical protein
VNHSRTITALLGLLMAGSTLFAHTPSQRFEARTEHREVRQQGRIAQGVRSGELTPRETAHLERQEARIDRNIDRAEADGKVTPREARRINREQNVESRRIFRLKHNGRQMP